MKKYIIDDKASIMEISKTEVQMPTKSWITGWLSRENSLLTTVMECTVTNAKFLAVVHGAYSGYWLLRSLEIGYPAMGICLVWFIIALVVCLKIK